MKEKFIQIATKVLIYMCEKCLLEVKKKFFKHSYNFLPDGLTFRSFLQPCNLCPKVQQRYLRKSEQKSEIFFSFFSSWCACNKCRVSDALLKCKVSEPDESLPDPKIEKKKSRILI